MKKTTQIHIVVDEAMKEQLEKIASEQGMSLSTYIRTTLIKEIKMKEEVK